MILFIFNIYIEYICFDCRKFVDCFEQDPVGRYKIECLHYQADMSMAANINSLLLLNIEQKL